MVHHRVTRNSLVATNELRRGRGQQSRWKTVTQIQLIAQCYRILEIIQERQTFGAKVKVSNLSEKMIYVIGTRELSRKMGRDKRYIGPILKRLAKSGLIVQERPGKGERWPWKLTDGSTELIGIKSNIDQAIQNIRQLQNEIATEIQRGKQKPDESLGYVLWMEQNMLINSQYSIARATLPNTGLTKDLLTFVMIEQIDSLSKLFSSKSALVPTHKLMDRSGFVLAKISDVFFDQFPKERNVRNALADVTISWLKLLNNNEETREAIEKDILFWFCNNQDKYPDAAKEMIERILLGIKNRFPELVTPRNLSNYSVNYRVEPYKILCNDPSDPYFERVKKLTGRKD